MKIYKGMADKANMHYTIFVIDSEGIKKPYHLAHVVKHSPTGISWGYGGSGPADCALSILIDFTGSISLAEKFYQKFKWAFIEPAGDELIIPGSAIDEWLKKEKD